MNLHEKCWRRTNKRKNKRTAREMSTSFFKSQDSTGTYKIWYETGHITFEAVQKVVNLAEIENCWNRCFHCMQHETKHIVSLGNQNKSLDYLPNYPLPTYPRTPAWIEKTTMASSHASLARLSTCPTRPCQSSCLARPCHFYDRRLAPQRPAPSKLGNTNQQVKKLYYKHLSVKYWTEKETWKNAGL